jgi:hypothetical protein
MTANQDGAAIGPPGPEKAAALGGKSQGGIACCEVNGKRLGNAVESVKREARQHLERWLTTGQRYHLALARAAFDAVRKGAS